MYGKYSKNKPAGQFNSIHGMIGFCDYVLLRIETSSAEYLKNNRKVKSKIRSLKFQFSHFSCKLLKSV